MTATVLAPYVASAQARERALHVRGQLRSLDVIEPQRAALVVIDMQKHFVAEGAAGEVPTARAIVPTIDAFAAQMRRSMVLVVWVLTDASRALRAWPTHHQSVLSPERAQRRIAALDSTAEGFALYPGLTVEPSDLRVTKVHYSAFIAGSSDLDMQLRQRGIETLLIAGTATNVCCDSTARDATMLNYRVVMLSDAVATWTDAEQTATLDTFGAFFGDVMTCADAFERFTAERALVPRAGE